MNSNVPVLTIVNLIPGRLRIAMLSYVLRSKTLSLATYFFSVLKIKVFPNRDGEVRSLSEH